MTYSWILEAAEERLIANRFLPSLADFCTSRMGGPSIRTPPPWDALRWMVDDLQKALHEDVVFVAERAQEIDRAIAKLHAVENEAWEVQWRTYVDLRELFVKVLGGLPSNSLVYEVLGRVENERKWIESIARVAARNPELAGLGVRCESLIQKVQFLEGRISRLDSALERFRKGYARLSQLHFPRPKPSSIDLLKVTEEQCVIIHSRRNLVAVHGVAGTGKSVVLAHRSILLATWEQQARVLVLSPTRALAESLRNVIEGLYGGMHPRVSVMDLNAFVDVVAPRAARLGATKGRTDETGANTWSEFISNVEVVSSQSRRDRLAAAKQAANGSLDYLRDEFEFIDGEGWIDSRDDGLVVSNPSEYLNVMRRGRGHALNRRARESVMAFYRDWEDWRTCGAVAGLNARVRDAARSDEKLENARKSFSDVRHVVVDEYQRFSSAGIVLLRDVIKALPGRVSLTFGGDPNQAGFRRSYSMQRLGFSLSGRSHWLRKPLRTTREIEALCHWLRDEVNKKELPDGEDSDSGRGSLDSEHSGGTLPCVYVARRKLDAAVWVASWVGARMTTEQPQSVAIILFDERLREMICCELKRMGVEFRGIASDDEPGREVGLAAPGVFIAPHVDVAQGLEFDAVCCVDVSKDTVPAPWAPADEDWRAYERLYSAVSRARQDVALVAIDRVSRLVRPAIDAGLANEAIREPG